VIKLEQHDTSVYSDYYVCTVDESISEKIIPHFDVMVEVGEARHVVNYEQCCYFIEEF